MMLGGQAVSIFSRWDNNDQTTAEVEHRPSEQAVGTIGEATYADQLAVGAHSDFGA